MDLNRLYQTLTDWLQRDRAGSVIRLSDFDRLSQQLRPGDVLLIDGRSPLDETLKTVASSRWSRLALYLGRLHQISDPALRHHLSAYLPCHPDTGLILQARLDTGVVLQPLTSLSQEHLRICRPRGLRDAAVDTVLRHAISRLGVGAPRSWFAVFTLLLPWGLLPRRWRCSAFAALAGNLLQQVVGTPVGDAFAFVQFPVLPLVKSRQGGSSRLYSRQPGIYFAADFDHSPYMDVVKYPFIDQLDNSRVRLQPWHGDAEGLGADAVAPPPPVRLVEQPRSAAK
ncbi:MAG: hypothetical protein ACK4SX_06855 [Alcanivoracaceae bacterium]